ncbi:protein kinase [Cutibacterium sp. WCA-380-WT-3A]|uniref:Protein kinase n=1 Tax=Cutibacterium porci TaxID=2605781 RepID=A0A7K0J7C9_9ACTN|nr:protein kinase [Cutibacterium porci]MSS45855.1 protein kinase [Cutibacterium porci]
MTMSTDPLVGHILEGRYEIVSKIARGGMATVYRAQDLCLPRIVAVKVMHEGLDAELAERFDSEAKAAARLINPHVVSVFDQGMDGDRPFIVMEYVPGCTLRHIITQEAPLTPVRALDLLEPVVSALASAHEDGLVHRDVKPENVLISDRGHIKVADFGLARAVGNHTMSATSGQLIGTVSYIPPERVTRGSSDERSDIYSAGIVLFEMLTGHKPHTGDSPIQVAWAHVNKDVPAPSHYLAHGTRAERDIAWLIPGYLDGLVRACTSRDPAKRPENGRALLDLLRRVRHALTTGQMDDPALRALQTTAPQPDVVITNPVTSAPGGSTDRSTRRRSEPVRPGTASIPPWSRTPVSPHTPVSSPDAPLSPMDRQRIPARPTSHSRPRSQSATSRTPRAISRSRLAQDAVHRRRRGVIAALFIVVVAVLCAYLVFHFTSSRYSASELHSTNVVTTRAVQMHPGDTGLAERPSVHGESSGMHTVSQHI